MAKSPIEWCTHVYNPFTGCDRVSPGCAYCYAATVAAGNQRRELGRGRVARERGQREPTMRYQTDGNPKTSGPGFGFTVHQDKLDRPERFPAGARVFVNSMSDVFHEDAPAAAIAQLFAAFAARPDVDWLVLTKRPERMRALMLADSFHAYVLSLAGEHAIDWPLPNAWLGVTVENRAFTSRARMLVDTPAAVRFISAEPLLGPLIYDAVQGTPRDIAHRHHSVRRCWLDGHAGPELELAGIDWLIAGGESGSHLETAPHRFLVTPDGQPRADRLEWIRDLRDACDAAGTAFFVKQLGGRRAGSPLEDLPADLRIRQLPVTGRAVSAITTDALRQPGRGAVQEATRA